MKKFSLLLVLNLLTVVSFAQSRTNLDGKYLEKFENGGFEDTIIIHGDTLTHVLNKPWGYGIEDKYVFEMIVLEDSLTTFTQIGYIQDGIDEGDIQSKEIMHKPQARITKLEDGSIQFISPYYPNNPLFFELIVK